MPDTTIRLPARTRDRLRKFGTKGQSYADILDRLMDEVDYKTFLREQIELLDEAVATKDKLVKLRDA